jgi:FtsH-binding integral membrane protein
MTASQNPTPSAQTARVIHIAMCAGVILFAIVAHFVLLPKRSGAGLASITPLLLALSLAACVVGIFLSRRVPRPSSGESADSFWMRAGPPALIAWAFLEGVCLLDIVLYSQTGSGAAISIAAVSVLVFILLNPAHFEGR